MEFVEGATLREKIHRDKTGLRTLLKYLAQVADGLAKAHAAGIVHRDLKPDNIIISSDGFAKILDFGLAKLVEMQKPPSAANAEEINEATTAMMPPQPLSTPGMIIGTVGYMSPEQAQGKPDIDHRSDIFSFGCVLFEAATGRKAFAGDSVIDTLHKIIKAPAPPLRDFNPEAPADLQRVVRRCLQKDLEERYQSIKDVAIELKELRREMRAADNELDYSAAAPHSSPKSSISGNEKATAILSAGGGATANQSAALKTDEAGAIRSTSSADFITGEIKNHKFGVTVASLILLVLLGIGVWFFFLRSSTADAPIDSIAVLPFQNRSTDADTEYLSDGLAESLIHRLSQLPNLKVSPTSSVFRYKGNETDAVKVGNELGVNTVMSGRMVKRGDNLTISVELIDVRDNKLLWGEQYDRKMSELLATQREIATEITQKLQLKLSGNEKGLTKRYTDNNEAYQLYLKGRYHFAKRTKDDMQRSIEYFQQAVRLDPDFALAYASIAECYNAMPFYPYLAPKESFPKAKAAAERALEIDPTLPEAHTALAYYFATYEWNWAEAERGFKRAIEIDPTNSAAHFRYGQFYLAPLGRHEEAITELKRAVELEPLSLVTGAILAESYMVAGQNNRALEQARKTYDLEPNLPLARYALGLAYIANGMYAEAIALSEKALHTDPTSQTMLWVAACGYAKQGRRQEAEEVIERFKDIAKKQYVMSYFVANIYAALGDKEKAFAELEKSFAERDLELHRLKVDPLMDSLRDDPRFKEMLKRLNLPE
jgi:eukaryotic-like serine/threonine-protein kinase